MGLNKIIVVLERITKPMMGFKNFVCAATTLAGIELYHTLRKGQHVLSSLLPTWQQFYILAT
jgi:putative transposase